jgi:hypothetical protein
MKSGSSSCCGHLVLVVIVAGTHDLPRHDRGHGLQALAAGTLAGLHGLVDVLVGDDGHLLQVAQQPLQLLCRGRLRVVGQEPGRAVEHRMQLGQGHHGFMGLLRQQHLVFGAEQPIHKALELLRAHAGEVEQGLARGQHLEARQPERVREFWCSDRRFHRPCTSTCITSSTSSAEANSGNSPPQAWASGAIGETSRPWAGDVRPTGVCAARAGASGNAGAASRPERPCPVCWAGRGFGRAHGRSEPKVEMDDADAVRAHAPRRNADQGVVCCATCLTRRISTVRDASSTR